MPPPNGTGSRASCANAYVRSRRRLLLDMHIPDWDPGMLADYSPSGLADLYSAAGADAALVYCKSHMGLSYWPTPVGGVHAAARERDLVGEVVHELRRRSIAVAAYHSVIFDNWAAENHPEWRVVPATRERGLDWHMFDAKYGTLCPNQLAYREYERTQVQALLRRYGFETLWIDMAFWTALCVCEACEARARQELGYGVPRVVDWSDPRWCRFQVAREHWMREFFVEIKAAAREVDADVWVTHNLAPGLHNWFWGQRADGAADDDFVAGDLYGGRQQQIFVLALMRQLRSGVPTEFMTSRTRDLHDHTSTKTEHEMLTQALAAQAYDSSFLLIDSIDPQGTMNPAVYERIGRVFRRSKAFDGTVTGTPRADVAVYYSDDSRVHLDESGTPAGAVHQGWAPHSAAATGAGRALSRAHIAFTVITRLNLHDLGRFRALVLPDACRLSMDEIGALRSYVLSGGLLYASSSSSLYDPELGALENFGLAGLFGVRFAGLEEGHIVYLRPETEAGRAAILPERYLSHGYRKRELAQGTKVQPVHTPVVEAVPGTEVLARITEPYGYPSPGSIEGHDFASIHSSPPWRDTARPAVVRTSSGAGRVVYTTQAIESDPNHSAQALFLSLLSDGLGFEPTCGAEAHPDVWVTVFDDEAAGTSTVSALYYTDEAPPGPAPVRAWLVPRGEVAEVHDAVTGAALPWSFEGEALWIDLGGVADLTVATVKYRAHEPRS